MWPKLQILPLSLCSSSPNKTTQIPKTPAGLPAGVFYAQFCLILCRKIRNVFLRRPRRPVGHCRPAAAMACATCECLPEIATSAFGLLAMTNMGASSVLSTACTNRQFIAGRGQPGPYNKCMRSAMARATCKCLPEIATSAYGLLAMTNMGASSVLSTACTNRQFIAGRGMPLPYNGQCGRRWLVRPASAFPRLHPKGTSSRFALRAPRARSALAMTEPRAFRKRKKSGAAICSPGDFLGSIRPYRRSRERP